MTAYYNEWEPYPAQWLRNLIAANLVAPGDVDERSIKDVTPNDLKGYSQCHFFAGIGGWSYALRLAGWPDERPVWTGSCPCQPYSSAGKGKGQSDERHLWPSWHGLISECGPTEIFGEQVSRAIAYGWLDEVKHDLESENYAFAAALLPACSVKAPHERERIFFVAHAENVDDRRDPRKISEKNGRPFWNDLSASSGTTEISDAINLGCQGKFRETVSRKSRKPQQFEREFEDFNGGWPIRSPKLRSVDDGLLVGASQICAYGNAIVPQVTQEFIEAYMECRP